MDKQKTDYSLLSYGTFLKDRENFRQSGTYNGSEFNIYDTPSQKYFRIFFYFWNGDIEKQNELQSGGLLAPLWQNKSLSENDYWQYTSAWTYLKINGEEQRAKQLQQFVELLSNINSESPWYFQQIDGLSDALDRQQTMKNDFMFEEGRKKITIKCLPDAYDDRISTLLDLYKAITWSWQTKRFILPANLRKFDMGVYIFETPIKNIHNPNKINQLSKQVPDYANLSANTDSYRTSSKYIEFHNCEIDYNSARNGLATLDNIEGTSPIHSIDIYFDDCYENRYNEFYAQEIGDIEDIEQDSEKTSKALNDFEKRSNIYRQPGPVSTAAGELIGYGTSWLKSQAKHLILGNMYGFSISKISDQVDAMSLGHLWTTVDAVKKYTENKKKAKTKYTDNLGNIFKAKSTIDNI